MKWFKHISDSIDDPFIFELMRRFGGDGYLTFFGVLEIYAREFQTELGWKLTTTQAYLKQKLCKRQGTVIIKCLEYIATHGKLPANSMETPGKLDGNSRQTPNELPMNSKKVFQNSGKWDVAFEGDDISIFIPKFRELLDESTLKKLREAEKSFRNGSGMVPKTEATDKDIDLDKDIDKEDIYSKEYTSPEASGDEISDSKCPHQEIIKIYHDTLPSLSKVKEWTEQRQKILKARWREKTERQSLDWWSTFFSYVSESDFLMGRIKPEFQADLEWLVRPKNFVKVIEGKYHRQGNKLISESSMNILGWAERERQRLEREEQE